MIRPSAYLVVRVLATVTVGYESLSGLDFRNGPDNQKRSPGLFSSRMQKVTVALANQPVTNYRCHF